MSDHNDRIVEFFKSGAATPEQWENMAECVLIVSCEGTADEAELAGVKLLEAQAWMRQLQLKNSKASAGRRKRAA